MGGRLLEGADHGWQDVGLERRAWTLSQAVSGSVGSQGAATNVSSLLSGLIGPGDRKSISADGGAAWVVRIRSTKMISFRTDWRPIGK